MKESPILFSAPMVRAILEGRKSQTRRVVSDATSRGNFRASELLLDHPNVFADPGPSPAGNPGWYLHAPVNCAAICARRGWDSDDCDPSVVERLYPRWFAGDRLWVRETFARNWNQLSDTYCDRSYVYRANGEERALDNGSELPWTPGRFMPKAAARITLEVLGVRVERLRKISREGAIAEGMPDQSPITRFAETWDSINAKRGFDWDSSPWVWVIEFRRVHADAERVA